MNGPTSPNICLRNEYGSGNPLCQSARDRFHVSAVDDSELVYVPGKHDCYPWWKARARVAADPYADADAVG